MASSVGYSIPREAEAIFRREILGNLLMQHLPSELNELARFIHFEGTSLPSIPVNWRWAESVSALKALEASMVNYLLKRKYGTSPVRVVINTWVYINHCSIRIRFSVTFRPCVIFFHMNGCLYTFSWGMPKTDLNTSDHASLFIFLPRLAQIVDSDGDLPSTKPINPDTLQPFRKEKVLLGVCIEYWQPISTKLKTIAPTTCTVGSFASLTPNGNCQYMFSR